MISHYAYSGFKDLMFELMVLGSWLVDHDSLLHNIWIGHLETVHQCHLVMIHC